MTTASSRQNAKRIGGSRGSWRIKREASEHDRLVGRPLSRLIQAGGTLLRKRGEAGIGGGACVQFVDDPPGDAVVSAEANPQLLAPVLAGLLNSSGPGLPGKRMMLAWHTGSTSGSAGGGPGLAAVAVSCSGSAAKASASPCSSGTSARTPGRIRSRFGCR
jgi:hypothetical protein